MFANIFINSIREMTIVSKCKSIERLASKVEKGAEDE